MNSIYSISVLQRICDHFGIGRIEDVERYDVGGRGVWRHQVETNQGSFDLYSYPTDHPVQRERQLVDTLLERMNIPPARVLESPLVRSFDRYHRILPLEKKQQISPAQAAVDFSLFAGQQIQKAFRVYGTIIQIHCGSRDVNDASTLVSYGWWKLQSITSDQVPSDVDTTTSSHDELDAAIESMEELVPTIETITLTQHAVEVRCSHGIVLTFQSTRSFPALELHVAGKMRRLVVYDAHRVYYSRSARSHRSDYA